jgi:hypothetical protein
VQPKQQRAFYWLGYIEMRHDRYGRADGYFTQALETDIREIEKSSHQRRWDLHYNRACTRSRIGEAAEYSTNQKKYEELALADLDAACPP